MEMTCPRLSSGTRRGNVYVRGRRCLKTYYEQGKRKKLGFIEAKQNKIRGWKQDTFERVRNPKGKEDWVTGSKVKNERERDSGSIVKQI